MKKLTYNDVKSYIESYGYKLLSDNYVNCLTPIKIQCEQGHIIDSPFDNFKKRPICVECNELNRLHRLHKEILELLNCIGYKLKTDINTITSVTSSIIVECDKGHVYNTLYVNLKNGNRCNRCYHDTNRYSYSYIVDFFNSHGYIVKSLSNEYINCKFKFETICPEGHTHYTLFSRFKEGVRCKKCYLDNNISNNNPNWKGGRAQITDNLRRDKRYNDWQINSKQYYGYRCIITNVTETQLHHLIPFNKILYRFFKCKTESRTNNILEYNNINKDRFFIFHNKLLGVPLSKKIHDEFHNIYGKKNFTYKNFKEFYFNKTGKDFKTLLNKTKENKYEIYRRR